MTNTRALASGRFFNEEERDGKWTCRELECATARPNVNEARADAQGDEQLTGLLALSSLFQNSRRRHSL